MARGRSSGDGDVLAVLNDPPVGAWSGSSRSSIVAPSRRRGGTSDEITPSSSATATQTCSFRGSSSRFGSAGSVAERPAARRGVDLANTVTPSVPNPRNVSRPPRGARELLVSLMMPLFVLGMLHTLTSDPDDFGDGDVPSFLSDGTGPMDPLEEFGRPLGKRNDRRGWVPQMNNAEMATTSLLGGRPMNHLRHSVGPLGEKSTRDSQREGTGSLLGENYPQDMGSVETTSALANDPLEDPVGPLGGQLKRGAQRGGLGSLLGENYLQDMERFEATSALQRDPVEEPLEERSRNVLWAEGRDAPSSGKDWEIKDVYVGLDQRFGDRATVDDTMRATEGAAPGADVVSADIVPGAVEVDVVSIPPVFEGYLADLSELPIPGAEVPVFWHGKFFFLHGLLS